MVVFANASSVAAEDELSFFSDLLSIFDDRIANLLNPVLEERFHAVDVTGQVKILLGMLGLTVPTE